MNLQLLVQEGLVLIPFITVIVEVLKRIFKLNNDFLPVFAMIVGVVLCFATGTGEAIKEMILIGIFTGLGSSGLFDNIIKAKKVIKGVI